jgi:8-oxo-dGTP diphosphatase
MSNEKLRDRIEAAPVLGEMCKHNDMRVVAGVIRDQGRFLACRRGGNHELAGQWEFPGGKVEPGETDQQALAREISEELGVTIVVEDFITQSTLPRGLGSIEMFTYFARLEGLRPSSSSDHDLLEWVAVEELPFRTWAALDIPVVGTLLKLAK